MDAQVQRQIVCNSIEAERLFGTKLKEIRQDRNNLKKELREWIKSPLEQIQKFRDKFNEKDKPLKTLEDAIVKALKEYRKSSKNQVAETKTKLIEIQKQNDADNPLPVTVIKHVQEVQKTIKLDNCSLTYAETWKAKVIDIRLVPTFHNGVQILYPKESELNNQARLSEGKNPPAGIEYYKDESPRTK
jgi:hypothetical protein